MIQINMGARDLADSMEDVEDHEVIDFIIALDFARSIEFTSRLIKELQKVIGDD